MSTRPISEDLVRFARAHLSSTTERHVYAVIDGSSEAWTATAAARAAKVRDHEADQALRRFHKARIADLDGGRPRRYRWRPEMAYLHEGTEPSRAICSMPVAADAPFSVEDGAVTVRFCSLACLVRWRAHRPAVGAARARPSAPACAALSAHRTPALHGVPVRPHVTARQRHHGLRSGRQPGSVPKPDAASRRLSPSSTQ